MATKETYPQSTNDRRETEYYPATATRGDYCRIP